MLPNLVKTSGKVRSEKKRRGQNPRSKMEKMKLVRIYTEECERLEMPLPTALSLTRFNQDSNRDGEMLKLVKKSRSSVMIRLYSQQPDEAV